MISFDCVLAVPGDGHAAVRTVNVPTSCRTMIVASLRRFNIGAKFQIFGAPSQDLLASFD